MTHSSPNTFTPEMRQRLSPSAPRQNGVGSGQARSPDDDSSIETLLALASKLYARAKRKELELLDERIEIGRILIRLKDEVGHGNFLKKLREWVATEKLNFGYTTANRAMAYAALDADGKLSSVRNLAEAEKVRNALSTKEREKKNDEPPPDFIPGEDEPEAKLTKPQIGIKARQLATPAMEECSRYDTETRALLLEELIEVFTEELEQCT